MTTSAKNWKTISELPTIDWNDAALAVVRGAGLTIVRRTVAGGEFVVIAVDGRYNRVLKTLPTLDRARAYANAVSR